MSSKPARIEPDRKWFGNVRTINQKNLEKLRVELSNKKGKPNEFLLKDKKVPMSLLKETGRRAAKVNILDFESFEVQNFGIKL